MADIAKKCKTAQTEVEKYVAATLKSCDAWEKTKEAHGKTAGELDTLLQAAAQLPATDKRKKDAVKKEKEQNARGKKYFTDISKFYNDEKKATSEAIKLCDEIVNAGKPLLAIQTELGNMIAVVAKGLKAALAAEGETRERLFRESLRAGGLL